METWQTCDGTEDCEDGADENRGHCNKQYVIAAKPYAIVQTGTQIGTLLKEAERYI